MAEVIGIVLGIFPIVVQGLQFYLDIAGKLKTHEKTMKDYVRRIIMEEAKFENTCGNLLEGTLPSGDANADLHKLVMERLQPNQADAFVEGVQVLHECLKELSDGIRPGEEKAVCNGTVQTMV